jgi:hypothetical protein
LLKQVEGRWASLFLDFRFYLARKTLVAEKGNAKIKGSVVPFQTKLELAGQMLIDIGHYFSTSPLLAVTDSWFGNPESVAAGSEGFRGSFSYFIPAALQ